MTGKVAGAAVGCVLLLALLVAGCGSGSSQPSARGAGQNEPSTLTFVTYLPVISPRAGVLLNQELAAFQAAHPGVRVRLQTAAAPTGPAVAALVQQDEAAGQTPDVVQAGLDSLRFMALGGLGAQDLGRLVGPQGLAAEWGSPHPYPPSLRALGQVNGSQYGIPWVLSTPVLFYNASLFKSAGLDPSKPPTTWAQMKADALQIKRATGADGLANCGVGASSGNVDWCTQAIVGSAGGSLLSPDGSHLTFTDPRVIDAMSVMRDLGQSGAMVNVTAKQSLQEFAEGKLAMILQSSAAQGLLLSVSKGKFGLLDAQMPGFDGHATTPTNSGSALAILAHTPARQAAAWQLIKFLTSDSAYTQITEQIGYAPLRTSLVADPRYLAGWARRQPLLTANLSQLARVTPWRDYPGPNYAQIQKLLEAATQHIAFDGADPAAALGQAQTQAGGLVQ